MNCIYMESRKGSEELFSLLNFDLNDNTRRDRETSECIGWRF